MSGNAPGDLDAVHAAFEGGPWPTTLCEGPDLVLSAVNEAARLLIGEHVGEAIAVVFPEPESRELLSRVQGVYATGTAFVAREWPVAREDDDGNPVTTYHHITSRPCYWPDGSIRGVITQMMDVTDLVRRRLDEESQRSRLQQRYLAAQDQIASLQDALLPEGLPIPQGLHLAARYLLAEDGGSAGGDWFDAVTLSDGRVVMSVGDVVGHGLRASVVMGELKTLFEERIRLDGDIVGALRLLDDRARRVPQARAATLCIVVLDPITGSLTYCTAGHPPPLVVDRTGLATYLPPTGGGPLGFGLGFPLAQHVLDEGELLLLYSDGLVERPGRTPAENTLDLARTVREAYLAEDPLHGLLDDGASLDEQVPERVVRQAVERLVTATGYDDDITVLAAHRVAPMTSLDLDLPARPEALRTVRTGLGDWLDAMRVGPLDEMALQHAVGELVSNVLEHAYTQPSGVEPCVRVHAQLTPSGAVEIRVEDDGHWLVSGDSGDVRGRGLAMASGFADEFELGHGDGGTTAVLRHRVLRAAELLTGSTGSGGVRPRRPRDEHTFHLRREGTRVHIGGVLDGATSDELRRHLAHATRGGTVDVVVDLGEVTLLASAAVQVLWEEMAGGGTPGSGMRLVAPVGSPAQHVLDVVRLPYSPHHDDESAEGLDETFG